MIGILEMYVPSFMKGEVKMYQQFGPFFAAYVFGVISGTIASPCVSPGLALLLSIVATLGNKFLGFCLLFAFGIGLSTPLMIIATFSNSLHLLPKSGMWMVEIKKLLGFFMLGTCFYYLANILPIAIVYWLFTLFTLFIGLFYFTGIYQYQNESYKTFYNIIAICMVSLSMFMGTKSYEKTFYQTTKKSVAAVSWSKNYATALEHAKEHNKLLLIDFWAQHCTMCKAIDKKVFENQNFAKQLEESVDFVKIDATQSDNPDYVYTKELYKVYAQPTIIVVDPKTETIVKRWTSEPYSMNIQDFITTILQIKNQLQSL
jgi:thiol:disulfide interchange protein DsbD